MARSLTVFVALCLFAVIPIISAQDDFGMAGFDDPPSTTPETSTVVAEPDIPSEETTTEPTTTTEVTTTTEATTTQETTIEPTTTEATTTEPTTTEETTIEPTTTEETTIEPTTTEATTTEETTIEPTTTEETTIEPTTTEETTIQPTTTEATTTEEMTIEPATTEATTTEETTVEPTTTEATTTEETTIEPTTTVETTIEPTTTEATTIQETTIEPTTTEAMTTEETTIEPTRTEATMMEKTTTETITTAATATEEITIESTMTEATTTEETTIEPTTTEATTTEETIHQISTTPLSANITTETSIPFIPEKKEPPSIAVGIDSSVFDFAVPLVHEDKTVLTTATESTQVISTTTPLMTTTTHEEVTTVEVTSTTEAAVVPKPILERPVAPPAPDHPPPIIFVPQPKGRIPEVPAYHGFQPIIYHQKPVGTTTTAPPPPIFIPEMPRIIPSRPRFQSPFQPQPVRKPVSDTAVPGFKYKEPPGQGRHHMSIIELTRLAFEQINRALTPARRSYTGPQYSTGTGLQQFFRPAVPMTRRPTTTTATTTTTQQFVNKFKLPADRSLTESKPWQSTAENTWTGLKFDLPAGSNVWGAGGLWPSLSQPIKPIQLPRVDAQTLKPGPSESFFPYSEPAKPPQKQLFNMPKGDASSNIWGSNDLWGHIQGTATTTARPEFQARPIVQNEFDKGKSVWTKPLMPQQLSEHKVDPLFKPPTYGIFGQQESANKRGTKVDVKPIPNTNQLFKMPGLWNLMTQKQSPPDRSSDVKSVWQAPTAVPIRPILVSDHTRNKTKQTVKSVIDTHPLKDLRASQHDIRFYNKPQSHQLYKPSINLVQDNMADLFLKASLAGSRSSLAGSRSRKTHLNPSRERFRNRSLQRKPVPSITTATTKKPLEFQQRPIYKQEHKTTPYIHKTTLYKHKPTPYKHRTTPYEQKIHAHEVKPIGEKHRTSPLTFEELLLRQLQGDASLFDMRRWGPKHLEKTSTTKTDSRRPGHIEEKPKSVSEIQKQQLPSATTIATYTERQTTQRVQRGSTPAPIAAEHPPPIFDSKVFRTFMPFPKDQPSSKESGRSGTKNLRGTSDIKPFGDPNEVKHGSCKGCTFVNDRCLLPDPVHCNRYIECVKQGPAVRVFTRECALGSFFDRKSFLCVDPKNADCPTDRCREEGLKSYIIHGHCKHYWVCGSRKGGGIFAQAECCPEGGGFVEGEGCVAMANCSESCDHTKNEEKIIGCKLRKTASPTEYFDENANIIRPCAPGTLFSEPKCTCIQDVTVEHGEIASGGPTCECSQGIPVLSGGNCSCREPTALEKLKAEASVCSPILNMTFSGGKIEDTSTTRQHVGIQNIAASEKGELAMTAKGRVILWRYSNLIFSDIFSVRLRFKPSQTGPRYQTILSNCDPESGNEPSISISLDTQYHEVIFTVNTYQSPSKKIKLYYQTHKWSTVFLIYDGERIVAAVDGRVRNIYAGGRIETRPHPIGIGSCGNKVGLHGLVDDVNFFEDCISDDMYDVFLNVLE